MSDGLIQPMKLLQLSAQSSDDLAQPMKLLKISLSSAAAFGSPAARFMATVCSKSAEPDALSFVEKHFNESTARGLPPAYHFQCQLMRLFSVQCIGDDYSSGNVPYFCFGRIDEICKKLGLEKFDLAGELQRTSLAAMLTPVYEPFFEYMASNSGAYRRERNSRYASSLYWFSLHRFLCEEDVAEVPAGLPEALKFLAEKVKLYIELHRADPSRFSEYWGMGQCVFFNKYCSVRYYDLYPSI